MSWYHKINARKWKKQVLNITYKAKKLANMLHQVQTNYSKQASFWKIVIIQLKIKILTEGLRQQILYQNLWNLSNYWSVKKSRGLFLFKRNEKKNRKGTLTLKMPFVARFSCCATIDFNSMLKYFPRGYDNKFYIKIFGIYPSINL